MYSRSIRHIARTTQIQHRIRYGVTSRLAHQCIRYESTVSSKPTEVPLEPILSPAAPPTSPRSRSTKYLRHVITILSFFLVGAITGSVVAGILIPPPLPLLDTEEDSALLGKLKRDYADLEIVRELRTPESKSAGWVEYESFMGMPEEVRDKHLSAGVLRGARGLGVRRMWWNVQRKQLIGVVFFGGALAGWPGVTHGGTIATVLMEGIATVANGGPRETRGFMSEVESEKELVTEFAIRYLKPTNANRMFLLRAEIEEEGDDTVTCWLEDVYTGKTTAIATGKTGGPRVIMLGDGTTTKDGILSRVSRPIFG